jgi:large subunit ribosomal protein L28
LKCDICGKTPQFGNTVSHSKRHTKRRWEPNIHPAIIMIDGKKKRLNLCTRCLRTHHKEPRKLDVKQGSPVVSR